MTQNQVSAVAAEAAQGSMAQRERLKVLVLHHSGAGTMASLSPEQSACLEYPGQVDTARQVVAAFPAVAAPEVLQITGLAAVALSAAEAAQEAPQAAEARRVALEGQALVVLAGQEITPLEVAEAVEATLPLVPHLPGLLAGLAVLEAGEAAALRAAAILMVGRAATAASSSFTRSRLWAYNYFPR